MIGCTIMMSIFRTAFRAMVSRKSRNAGDQPAISSHASQNAGVAEQENQWCYPRFEGKIFFSFRLRNPTQTNETIH
jgi:hypothetical protein